MVRLSQDAISDIGCNIVSGIILEKILENKLTDFNYYINIYTLYRNFLSCIEGDTETKIKILKDPFKLNKLFILFKEDTEVFISNIINNNIEVTIYYPNYKEISKKYLGYKSYDEFKGLKYFIYTTQDPASKYISETIKGILYKTDHRLPYKKNLYITTHIGLDLFNFKRSNDIKLLESHTGEIKDRTKFYTKLHKFGKRDMSIIPLTEITYQIFGDNEFIKPSSIKTKKYIYEIAKKNNWYFNMTDSDVLYSIKRRDAALYEQLKNLKTCY